MTLNFNSLNEGYDSLLVFYGSYSYWIKEDEDDNVLKDDLIYNQNKLVKDISYVGLSRKTKGGLKSFGFKELRELNTLHLENITILFKTFETFCKRFAPNDMLPNLTENVTEHDRAIGYVEYDIFFDNFYSFQEEIHKKLLDFSIMDFRELFTLTMGFFYGYSYYLQPNTQKVIKDMFKDLYEVYNSEEFLKLYYGLLQENLGKSNILKLVEYKDKMFSSCLNVFELINADLPKTNIMPKKNEKVLIDKWSI